MPVGSFGSRASPRESRILLGSAGRAGREEGKKGRREEGKKGRREEGKK
jgi:hypothetical protein